MPVTRMNHAVLYVRDVARSVAFYREVLEFRVVAELPGAVFLQAAASRNDHDLGLFSVGPQAGASTAGAGGSVGLYHVAWEVDTLGELERLRDRLVAAGALVGSADHGTTKALYARDPDGLEFEVSWLVPADRLPPQPDRDTRPLDIAAEKARYGAATRGGVGISSPAAV